MAATLGSTPPFATEADYTTGTHHFTHPGDYEDPLSPLSPAESLESLPPTTPPDEYRYPNRLTSGGIPTTMSGRLLEYPSPPTTTSDPKYPVPLPSTNNTTAMTSHTNTNFYEFPYDPIRHDCVPGPLYFGGLLDSPRSIIHHSTFYIPSLSVQPPLNPWRLLGASIDDEVTLSPAPDHEPPSPTSPFTNSRPPLFEGEGDGEDVAALLSPLSPEWPSHTLDALSPLSDAVEITRSSRSPGEDEPPPSYSAVKPPLRLFAPPSSSRPTLPLLSIPTPSFSNLRSYDPSPSSPLWLADELDLESPPCGADDSETSEQDGNAYMVSPPSSGPPDTPSPRSALLPLSLLNLGDDHDVWLKGEIEGISTEPFEHPPLIDTHTPPPIPPSIPLPLRDPTESWFGSQTEHEEKLEKELLRSPSIRFREYVDLPEVGGGAISRFEDNVAHALKGDEGENDSNPGGLPSFYDATAPANSLEPPWALISSPTLSENYQPDQHPLEPLLAFDPVDDLSIPERSPNLNLDPSIDLNTIDPETLNKLPLQEVEEIHRIAELQVRATEYERVAKDLEMRVVEASSKDSVGSSKAPLSSEVSSGRGEEEEYHKMEDHVHDEKNEGFTATENLAILKNAAADARALAKREREKAREACALVRLKIKEIEEVRSCEEKEPQAGGSGQSTNPPLPSFSQSLLAALDSSELPPLASASTSNSLSSTMLPPRKHPRLAGIAQLVAKMFLNRHDSGTRKASTVLSPLGSPTTPPPASDDIHYRGQASSSSSTSGNPSSSPPDTSLYSTSTPSPSHQSPSLSSPPLPTTAPYKYKHLWVKGAAAGLRLRHPSTRSSSSSQGHGLGIADKFGPGATRQQPYAQYQRRYKFLRSSPLARYSVVASDVDEDEDLHGSEERISENDDAAVGGLWDDEEEENGESGFEALRNPIMWDAI